MSDSISSPSWLLDADWVLETANDRDFLLASKGGLTFTFVPMFQAGRKAWSFQYLDHRLPAGGNVREIEDPEILGIVRRGWEAAWRGRDNEREAKAAAVASRALDDNDIRAAIAGVGATRLMRVVAGKTSDPGVYATYAPETFNISMLREGFFPAGLIWLAVDTIGHRVGRRAFRGVDETWALKVLGAAERSGVRKVSGLMNRTELERSIRAGQFFD